MTIGHFYFLNDQYAKDFPNPHFMNAHKDENHNRPYFCAFADGSAFWLIPISSHVEKFERIYNQKIARYGKCDTIDFCDVLGHRKAVLLQNMCPATDKYIKNEYLSDGTPVQIPHKDRKKLISKAKKVVALQKKGLNLIFGDVLETLTCLQ